MITLIECGGTISCEYDGKVMRGGRVSLQERLRDTVDKAVSPFMTLSENMDFELLHKLHLCVLRELESSDGIILAHGTDTLSFTAAYLALSLGTLSRPVVIVSADYPLSDSRSNGEANIRAAKQIAKSGAGGVFVPYRNPRESRTRVHLGQRLLFARAFDGALFSAGQQNGDFAAATRQMYDGKNEQPINQKIKPLVRYVRAYPGLDYARLGRELELSGEVCMIEGYHSGTVKTSGTDSIGAIKTPVYLCGGTSGAKYESLSALNNNVVAADNIAAPALYVKLCMAYTLFGKNAREWTMTDRSGEFF